MSGGRALSLPIGSLALGQSCFPWYPSATLGFQPPGPHMAQAAIAQLSCLALALDMCREGLLNALPPGALEEHASIDLHIPYES